MISDPRTSQMAPHPAWTYPARTLWVLVQVSIWRAAWKRCYILRPALLRIFGANVAWRTQIAGSVKVYFPWRLSINGDTAIGPGVTFYNLGGLEIGARVVISQNAYFCGGTHDYTKPNYPLVCELLRVEDDVWVGAAAFICPGVRIGQGAVIGACAVVTKDVAPWSIVAGNPARVIGNRVIDSSSRC